MSVRPSQLPRLRRQTRQHLHNPESALRSKTGENNSAGLDALATAMDAADLFWVSQDMAALAMHSGGQLAAARWATADRPAPCGLLFWQGGIGHIDARGVQVPVEACAWGPFKGGMLLWLLMSRARLSAEVARIGRFQMVEEQIPPLIPVCGAVLPVTDDPVPFAGLDQELPQPIVAALAAAWLVMQQPLLIDRTRERPDKSTARAIARDGLTVPDVTVVDLRRQYTPQDQEPGDETAGRHYKHRWIVSGHWRNQAYGRGRSLRRQTWVPAHVKGPEGAPMLATEKVNVWRR
ncbi:hypothetical protein [Streptomyces sp. NPDC059783]|uniref:hypothetical protein n=1 Tax=Streptomyces sp. NPDC059783 TaxID=3346944 RepID=UPI003666F13C